MYHYILIQSKFYQLWSSNFQHDIREILQKIAKKLLSWKFGEELQKIEILGDRSRRHQVFYPDIARSVEE